MANKSNKAEAEKRLNQIVTMLIDGFPTFDIVRYGTENWKISKRAVEKYITKANEEISSRAKIDRDRGIDWHLEARKKNLSRAISKEDHRLVKDILRDLAEMQGLYPKKQMEVHTKSVPTTRDEILSTLAKFAQDSGLTLDEYCKREGIEIEEIPDVIQSNN